LPAVFIGSSTCLMLLFSHEVRRASGRPSRRVTYTTPIPAAKYAAMPLDHVE
jgi:hypothetical protein